MNPTIHLVTRADDAGSCRSANEAILEGAEAGTIKNVSFMAVGPAIEHAAQLLGGRDDIACGLHVCLNAEWDTVKWGPLSGSSVLTDERGHFWPFPHETKARLEDASSFDRRDLAGVVASEINAQLRRLQSLGLKVSYVDEHMGVSWIAPELRAVIEETARLHNLVDAHAQRLSSLPDISTEGDDFATLEARLGAATGGRYLWVTHPGKVAPDMNAFFLRGEQPGAVARERDAERRLLGDPRLPELFEKWNVSLARYDEL